MPDPEIDQESVRFVIENITKFIDQCTRYQASSVSLPKEQDDAGQHSQLSVPDAVVPMNR